MFNFLLVPLPIDGTDHASFRGDSYLPQDCSRAEKARAIYTYRTRRARHLPCELMGEPGWDILLLLYFLEAEMRQVSVIGVCAGSGVANTTALRWIALLEKREYLTRHDDAEDKRRRWVSLTPAGREMMDQVLDELL